ncbi:MAG TPA: hypothetical protein VLA95_01220 [Gemmatimonadales bacterium]|nr:hypothetical protein [Gemmatimonadales bacterium]
MRGARLAGAALVLVAALVSACQEELVAPGDCPALCPGESVVVFDTILDAEPLLDSTFVGYTARGFGAYFLVSDGLPGLPEHRGLVRYFQRPDSILVQDTMRAYVIDSVRLAFTIAARDTAVKHLRALLYRMPDPLAVDTATDWTTVAAAIVEANLVDSVLVDDTTTSPSLAFRFLGADLARVAIPAADSGTLALAVVVRGDAPTGARFVALGTGGPSFTTYVTADVADTTVQEQVIFRTPTVITWVQDVPETVDPDRLTVGGAPSARSLVRFRLPEVIRDSARISRATLEFTTTGPIAGLPGDSTYMQARTVLVDLGAKSPTAATGSELLLAPGTDGTIALEATALARAWLGESALPSAVMLALELEAASFMRPVLASTRGGGPPPRIRITYTLPYRFGGQ